MSDLIARLERLPVMGGSHGYPKEVVVPYEDLKAAIDSLRSVTRKPRVPREAKRS